MSNQEELFFLYPIQNCQKLIQLFYLLNSNLNHFFCNTQKFYSRKLLLSQGRTVDTDCQHLILGLQQHLMDEQSQNLSLQEDFPMN